MRTLHLCEHAPKFGAALALEEVDALRRIVPSIQIQPTPGLAGCYDVRPGAHVGVVRAGDLIVEIQPKLKIDRLIFMMSYVMDRKWWSDDETAIAADSGLLEALVPFYVAQVRKALRRGVLQGYLTVDEALPLVRGRVRFDDQIRSRFGRIPPVEVRHDDFTVDIELNRILKAATNRLKRLPLRSPHSIRLLCELDAALVGVSNVTYPRHHLPEIVFDRLNAHYRPAVTLATMILRSTSWELRRGAISATACLIDMNALFEDFMIVALRECLELDERSFPQGAAGHALWLDEERRVRLEPDLSWWHGSRPVFVGDVKYKGTKVVGAPNADVYQALAYAMATDLPGALLIYAAGEVDQALHTVPHAARVIEVVTMDLGGCPSEVRREVERVAGRVREWRMRSGSIHPNEDGDRGTYPNRVLKYASTLSPSSRSDRGPLRT